MLSNIEELLTIRRYLNICHEKASELISITDPYVHYVLAEEFDEHLDHLMDLIEGDYDNG